MVSGKPSQVKLLKGRKNFNLFLVFLCLTLVFLGKIDLVAVRNIKSDRVIQHAYIKARQSYKFKNIPVGTYVCNYMWTDRNGKRYFNKDDKSLAFKTNEVGGYVITMQKTTSGNLTQSSISEDEFFN